MAAPNVPYPPSPAWVPVDLLDVGDDTRRDASALMSVLVVFVCVYVTMILVCLAGVATGIIMSMRHLMACVGIPIALVSGLLAFLLVRVLFYSPDPVKGLEIEVTEEEQPTLFAFLRRLTDEIGAPGADRVYVTPDVNAAVVSRVSLANLIIPPKRDLHIGLGLVNVLTLSEFKAVMGHEFGHFAQSTGRLNVHIQVALRVLGAMIDRDRRVRQGLQVAGRRARYEGDGQVGLLFRLAVAGPLWCVGKVAWLTFYLVQKSRFALSRNHEFHADRVAVSVAGSNAVVHGLFRSKFGDESFDETVRLLDAAAQHDLYSRDLYFHHTETAAWLRRKRRDPSLGLPPGLRNPADGQRVRVFDPDEPDEGPPLMWRTHPHNYDREENAKKVFVPCEDDDRSPWVLFQDAHNLRERATYKFYRAAFRAKKSVVLRRAADVQKFIDDENAEVTYDPKYYGAYDDRWIAPGDIRELNRMIEAEPWDAGRLYRTHGRLYREIGRWADDFRDIVGRVREIYRKSYGHPRGKAKRRLRELEDDFEKVIDWFKGFDRRVYMIHAQMAGRLGPAVLRELSDRYSFHLKVQSLHQDMKRAIERVTDAVAGVNSQDTSVLPNDFFQWVRDSYLSGRRTMVECLQYARAMRAPEMASVPAGTRFDQLIFDQAVLNEPPESFVPGRWVEKLLRQMDRMTRRLHRMDFKSLGALLQMQDRIAAEWTELAAPPAILVDDEPPSGSPAPGATMEAGKRPPGT